MMEHSWRNKKKEQNNKNPTNQTEKENILQNPLIPVLFYFVDINAVLNVFQITEQEQNDNSKASPSGEVILLTIIPQVH